MMTLKNRLESAGVEFVKDSDDPSGYLRYSTCGMKGKWTLWFENGRFIKRLLAKEVRRSGGYFTRRWAIQRKGISWFQSNFVPTLLIVSVAALLIAMVVLFSLQGSVVAIPESP
ncbi:MAG: hypothetical protein ABH839_00320 [Chloroflexota bacterium]